MEKSLIFTPFNYHEVGFTSENLYCTCQDTEWVDSIKYFG